MSKETALVPQYGPTVNDAELVYWNGLTGGAHKNVKEAKHAFFDSQGIPWSVLNDREYRYLSAQFGAGTYNDLEEKYWQSGGSPIAAAVGTLSSAGRKGVLPGSAANRFWWADRARTRPWDPAIDLERTVEFVDDLTGNPVGWATGSVIFTNTFSSGSEAAEYTPQDGNTTRTVVAGELQLTFNGASNYVYKTFTTIPNTAYSVVFSARAGTNCSAVNASAVNGGGGGSGTALGATTGSVTSRTNAGFTFVATSTTTSIRLIATVSPTPGTAFFDTVTVTSLVRDESWLGANLVTNGDFSNGATGWTNSSSGTGTFSVSGGAATISGSDGANRGSCRQSVAMVAGRCYQLNIVVSACTGIHYFAGTTVGTGGVLINAAGTYSIPFAATASDFIAYTSSGGGSITFDNITVREIPGNPIVSAVSGSGLVGSKRVNLASQTENPTAAVWTAVVAKEIGATNLPGPFGRSTAFELIDTNAANFNGIRQTYTVPANADTYRVKVWVKRTSGGVSPTFGINLALSGGTGQNTTIRVNTDSGAILLGSATASLVGDFWQIGANVTNNGTNTSLQVSLYASTAGHGLSNDSASATGTAVVGGLDVRSAVWDSFNLPAYQRVGDGTAGVFDYDDAGFPLHLKNVTGTQAMMTLGTVDMSAGDAGVLLANVVKLSDATQQIVAETSASVATNAGSMYLLVPSPASGWQGAVSGSTSPRIVGPSSGTPAPDVAALILAQDISTDTATLMRNGVQIATGSGDQGSGNLGNYRLFIAGRDVGGTASLRFTGIYIGNFPALFAGDAGLNPLSLSREYAAQGGFVY